MAPPQVEREKPAQQAKDVLATASTALRQEGRSIASGSTSKATSSRPASAVAASSPPQPQAPQQSATRSQACQVCRLEPLLFHECPECCARYCSSGCLQSWYEHSKPSRAGPCQAPVINSEGGSRITVELPQGALGGSDKEAELVLKRLAGGFVMVETPAADSEKQKRWNVTSVDGWLLGMPGPGLEWRPARGVSLTLEELGSCRYCKTQLAVQEYICNSASRRPPSAQRERKRPAARTSEAIAQTEQDFEECVKAAVASLEAAKEALEKEVASLRTERDEALSARDSLAAEVGTLRSRVKELEAPRSEAFPLSSAAKPPPQDPVAAQPAVCKPPLPTSCLQAAASAEMQTPSQESAPTLRAAQSDTEMHPLHQELGDSEKSHLQQQSAEQLRPSPANPEMSCQDPPQPELSSPLSPNGAAQPLQSASLANHRGQEGAASATAAAPDVAMAPAPDNGPLGAVLENLFESNKGGGGGAAGGNTTNEMPLFGKTKKKR